MFWDQGCGFIYGLLNMHYISQVYERGTNVEQFVTRFLLKESANQIQSLLSSVESAVDAIDEQHSQSGWASDDINVLGCYVKLGNGSRFVHVYVSILKLGMSAIITGSISSCLHTHIHTLTHAHIQTDSDVSFFISLIPTS